MGSDVDVGGEAGDVWIDDAHFQQGATSLWRRDFQNGIVLVNPASQTLSAPLGATPKYVGFPGRSETPQKTCSTSRASSAGRT